MALIVTVELRAAEFALRETLDDVGDVRVTCPGSACTAPEAAMPLLRVECADGERTERAMAADPTVATVERLSESAGASRYRVEWAPRVVHVLDLLTGSEGHVVGARCDGSEWTLRLLYPDRDAMSAVADCCEDQDVPFRITRIQSAAEATSLLEDDDPDLTDAQQETLVTALDRAYFSVPRETTLEELADEQGISHQALSERIRRGVGELVETRLRPTDGVDA